MTGLPYLDSGAFVKLYVAESGSDAVQQEVEKYPRLPLNPFQELEVKTAIRAAGAREILTARSVEQALAFLEEDLSVGRLMRFEISWERVWPTALRLSAEHTAATLCRTLDLLHVAIAREVEAAILVTGDKRQASLCQRIGFPVAVISG